MPHYPTGKYGRQTLQFFPAPFRAPLRAFAALVFPWQEDEVLICNIDGRGWCIPSGRVEPGESSAEAALREAVEEGGALLSGLQYIGCYKISERREVRWADCYAAWVSELIDIGITAESLGRKFMRIDELETCYHVWNPLTELVFCHSHEVLRRGKQIAG
ncbi:MAG: NUDIX domain-containing protein [Fimbriimonadaceae bacterium]